MRARPRVPTRLQLTANDCGAACLAMVLGAHGRRTAVAEVRRRMATRRDGASARDLVAAGAAFGLRLRVFAAALADLGDLQPPLIAHWDHNHFVVVERVGRTSVSVVDPARGRLRMTPGEFAAGYSGVVATADAPGELEPAARSNGHALRALLAGALGDRRLLAALIGASLVVQVVTLATVPLFTRTVIDGAPTGELEALWPVLAVAALGAFLVHGLTTGLRSLLLIRLETGVAARLMQRLVEHTFSLPFRFFEQRSTGDLLSRFGTVAVLRDLVTERSLALGFDGLVGLGYLAILALASPEIAAVTLAAAALQGLIGLAAGRTSLARTQAALSASVVAHSHLVESLEGIETLKASGAEQRAVMRWRAAHDRELEAAATRDRHLAAVHVLTGLSQFGVSVGLLLVVAKQAASHPQDVGELIGLAVLATAALAPLSSLLDTAQQLFLAVAHLDRIADVMAAEPERGGGLRLENRFRGGVELHEVDFGYDDRDMILRGVSLRVEPGHRVAIVGPSGSGKTTLGRVLLGLLEPTRGDVRFDGIPLGAFDRTWLRRQIGVVPQNPFLFSGSIADAIAYGDPGATDEAVRAAAQAAEVAADIERLPLAYRSQVGESGNRLSGGQRQRIALARALVHRPCILLLDEPTSDLDAVAEERIRRNLTELGCTQIVIAHRLSTVRDADLIVVLVDGEIVETGDHETLLDRDGAYAELIRHQFVAAP